MCILCVVQKWSRRITAMLPWLLIPLIGFWALSQFLPPAFRFEITSPRLACVIVLLATLFWYEILMPQLSAWRVRTSARMREKKMIAAIELQKLRKTATRRCRNCFTPYRDQNPPGGRFTCLYCGHISKRPVLDIPSNPNSGRSWVNTGWICGQDWTEHRHWGRNNSAGFFCSENRCSSKISYPGVVFFICKLFVFLLSSITWIWRKCFWFRFSRVDPASDVENEMVCPKGENESISNESKCAKARRKAEEKRQARLEKELLEEEERKQREEVARLVEEQRKLRDTSERECLDIPAQEGDRNTKEVEVRKKERKKEKGKGSNKGSGSDGEETERKAVGEIEKKHEFDKRTELERKEILKSFIDSNKSQSNFTRRSDTNRYFDRMKGSFLSSSQPFRGSSLFGRGTQALPNTFAKIDKFNGFGNVTNKKPVQPTQQISEKFAGDGKLHPMTCPYSGMQPIPTVQKKTWQQLFTGHPVTSSPSIIDTSFRPEVKHVQIPSSRLSDDSPPVSPSDNRMPLGTSLPFVSSPLSDHVTNANCSVLSTEKPYFATIGNSSPRFISKEDVQFKDPCYIPNATSIIDPVSCPLIQKNVGFSTEVTRPSPIEPPTSRSRVSEEKEAISGHSVSASVPSNPNNSGSHGTWQMWNTTSLVPDGLGIVGGSKGWLFDTAHKKSNQVDAVEPLSHKDTKPMLVMHNRLGTHIDSLQKLDYNLRLNIFDHKDTLHPLRCHEEQIFPPLSPRRVPSKHHAIYGSADVLTTSLPSTLTQMDVSSPEDYEDQSEEKTSKIGILATPQVGSGLFSHPNVQSPLSLDDKNEDTQQPASK